MIYCCSHLNFLEDGLTGVIKALPPGRTYGFIRDEHGHDRFFHANDLLNAALTALRVGDAVRFDPLDTARNGRRAECVTLLTKES